MWTRKKLMRELPDITVYMEPDGLPCLGMVWEVTQTTATVHVLTGTHLYRATVPALDVVRQLNRSTSVTITTWEV